MSVKLWFGHFVLRPQAPGAKIKVLQLPVDEDSCGVNIGCPAPVSMAFGVADIMTELRYFFA